MVVQVMNITQVMSTTYAVHIPMVPYIYFLTL
jgi:hypothetical protein